MISQMGRGYPYIHCRNKILWGWMWSAPRVRRFIMVGVSFHNKWDLVGVKVTWQVKVITKGKAS